jgi:hypothetical protein
MNSKELRNLHEAYMDVYAPQEVDEAVKGESGERRKDLAAERRSGIKPLSAKEGQKYASHKLSQMSYVKRKRMGEEVEGLDESGLSQDTIRSAAKERQKRVDANYREDTPEGDKRGDKGMKKLARTKRQLDINKPREVRMRANEEVDIFDAILEHLIAEGYADTNESALVIMANMSEEWREDIVELYKGKHGQSEKEYMDGRSQGGKMISGDSKESGASYSHRSFRGQGKPAKPGKRQPTQGKMDSGTRADIQYRKANLKNR